MQLSNACAINTVALDGLLVLEGAVANLGRGKVEERVVVVLPYQRALCRVDNDGAVVNDADAPGHGLDFARAILQQMAGELAQATRRRIPLVSFQDPATFYHVTSLIMLEGV